MSMLIQKMYKYRRFALSLVVVLGIFFYAFWSSLATKDYLIVPEMFWQSRVKGDAIALEFVSLGSVTQENLEKIKELEEKGKTDLALKNIREEIGRGDSLKSKGTELLASLSQMTYSLGGIRPDGARAIAYEAITDRISMVNNLIAYSNELEQILRLLTSRVLYGDDIRSALQEKIDTANLDARNINDLNAKFNESIRKLESY